MPKYVTQLRNLQCQKVGLLNSSLFFLIFRILSHQPKLDGDLLYDLACLSIGIHLLKFGAKRSQFFSINCCCNVSRNYNHVSVVSNLIALRDAREF